MPFDVVRPQTITVQGDTLRSYEIDLTGTAGALANGTVSLGGKSWTLAGVGTSNELNLTIDLADIYADFDGSKHGIEICAKLGSIAVSAANSTFGIDRRDSSNSYWNSAVIYEFGGNKFSECSSNVDGSYTRTFVQRTTQYTAYTEWGLVGNGGMSSASWGSGASGAFRMAQQAHNQNLIAVDQNFYTEVFGAGDILRVFCEHWTTATSTASANQSASGLTLTFGATVVTIEKLYVYISTPELAS